MFKLINKNEVNSPNSMPNRSGSYIVKCSIYIYYFILFAFLMVKHANASTSEVDANENKVEKRYQVAKFTFEEVSDVYSITLWILLGSLAKIGKIYKYIYF